MRQMILWLVIMLSGCPAPPPEPETLFPEGLVQGVLDQTADEASKTILARYPTSTQATGSFMRYEVAGSQYLAEVIVFRSVRTDRVDSVILKYRPELTREDRRRVFQEIGHPALFGKREVSTVSWKRGMKLRVTPADRYGRLTLTVEP